MLWYPFGENPGAGTQKRGAEGAALRNIDCWRPQLAATAGMSRWRFMTILLSAPR